MERLTSELLVDEPKSFINLGKGLKQHEKTGSSTTRALDRAAGNLENDEYFHKRLHTFSPEHLKVLEIVSRFSERKVNVIFETSSVIKGPVVQITLKYLYTYLLTVIKHITVHAFNVMFV